MSETNSIAASKGDGTEITRFNALRHGVLSRYTVLPWEDADEYRALVASLVAEHGLRDRPKSIWSRNSPASCGASVGCVSRRRPPTGAGLENSFSVSTETPRRRRWLTSPSADKGADVSEAVRITPADTEDELRDLDDDEAMTRHALDILKSQRNEAYEAALAELREDTQGVVGGYAQAQARMNSKRTKNPLPRRRGVCAVSLKIRCCRGSRSVKRRSANVRCSASRLSANRSTPTSSSGSAVTRSTWTASWNGCCRCLLRLRDLRQGAMAG